MTKGHSGSAWLGDYGLNVAFLSGQGRPCPASAIGLRRESERFGRANAIDHSVTAITSAEVSWRHNIRQAGKLRRGADGSATPSGWAICDGTKGTSDLSNRFIIDGSRNEGIGSSAELPSTGTWRAGGELASAGHDRRVKTDPCESIPAFVTLIYIMKL
jgi:hypothetical protein